MGWSWWIFPTPPFLINGKPAGSETNRIYELKNDTEGFAYLQYGNLRENYLAILDVMNQALQDGVEPRRLLGMDVPRVEASVKYFLHLSSLEEGDQLLAEKCQQALSLLRSSDRLDNAFGTLPARSSVGQRAI